MHALARWIVSAMLLALIAVATVRSEDAKGDAKSPAKAPAVEPAKAPAAEPETEPEKEPEDESLAARKYMGKAKVTLTGAIKTAQAKLPKSKALEAYFEADDSEMVFVVEFVGEDKHQAVIVDAVTGEVLGVNDEKEEDKEVLALEAEIAKAPTTLLAAIDAAVKTVPKGKPYDAHPDKIDDKPVISVEILVGEKIIGAVIDPKTGKVLSSAPVEE